MRAGTVLGGEPESGGRVDGRGHSACGTVLPGEVPGHRHRCRRGTRMLTDRKWVALGAVFLLLTTFVGVGVAAPAQAAGATATLSGTVFYDDLPTKHVQGGYSVALHLPHSIDPAVLYVSTD